MKTKEPSRVVVINETEQSILRLFRLFDRELSKLDESKIKLIIFNKDGMQVIDHHDNTLWQGA